MTVRSLGQANVPVVQRLAAVLAQLDRIVVGKPEAMKLAVACLLARGHLLIEDIPGVGKSTLAQALAATLGLKYARVQFTSDLLPADVLGVSIFDPGTQAFRFHQGPVFNSVVLADEINRAPPKTQSALLEAMEERQVSLDGQTRKLPDPFFVIATQNPVEQIGAYPLPESQLDRFLMRLRMGYPDIASERQILRSQENAALPTTTAGLVADDVIRLQDAVQNVTVEDSIVDYMLAIVERTRNHESLALGVSPRGSQALYRAVQALSLVEGRDYAIPDDVKRLAVPLFAHRVVINTRTTLVQRRAEVGERIIEEILSQVEVPL
jgi:MoxR-like ATPase